MRKIIGVLVAAATLVGMAGPASAAAGNQRFTIVARFAETGNTACRIVAVGPIRGTGTCTVDQVSETVTILHVTLPGGTVDLKLKEFQSSDDINEQACIDNFTFKETLKVTGGTGAYANASGSGTDTGSGIFAVDRKPGGGCDESHGHGAVVVNATANVKL